MGAHWICLSVFAVFPAFHRNTNTGPHLFSYSHLPCPVGDNRTHIVYEGDKNFTVVNDIAFPCIKSGVFNSNLKYHPWRKAA